MDNTPSYPGHVLFIHAHPDDVEILAGGTVLRLIELGHKVTIVTMTAGDCGSVEYGPEEIAKIREAEARTAADFMGADYLFGGFQDLAIFNDHPSRQRVTEILRKVQPNIVVTASPVDYHCDHEATSVLVRDACFGAPAPNYRTGGTAPAMKEIPHLYFCDSDEGRDREGREIHPDFTLDVTKWMDGKAKALGFHVSQRDWLKKHHGMDNYIETMQEWSRGRGKAAGFEFGEGFRQYKTHPYPTTPLLQGMLGLA